MGEDVTGDVELQRRIVIEMAVPSILQDYDDDLVEGVIETDIQNLGMWDVSPSVEVVKR